jgi:hypothetical protein
MADLVLATPEFYQGIVREAPATGMLEAASSLIRRYCGWHIVPQRVDTVTVDGTGGNYLFLPTARLTELFSVVNDGTAVPLEDIEWSEAGMLKRQCKWTAKLRGVTVQYQHGFSQDDALDLAIQVVLIAARIGASPRGEISSSVGGVSVQYSTSGVVGASLTSYEEAQLAPYCTAGPTGVLRR